ncbi:hypothetical protein [Hymenobacter latericus]|uniref:hypothetical protein n=1 Tax=Hymenobacter sp. YIM 151858-1 TaxID=2987688 RepID=UPI002225DE0E|nr:hypothetical protein [Hymenobacter sp. YIM 151858-1]UYZ60085.1 hypothetical protein OIS50_04615 [Hymenobacter sp. YIM 151858-1]
MTCDLTPLANYLLVSVPARAPQPAGAPKLVTLKGADDWQALTAALQAGTEFHAETNEDPAQAPVNIGQVLRLPERLTPDMILCAGGLKNKGRRTAEDILQVISVGDHIYCDNLTFSKENELQPGIYRVPYSSVVCIVELAVDSHGKRIPELDVLTPVAGYVLLNRIWPAECFEERIDGVVRKVRRNSLGLVEVCAPLDNEGIVAYAGDPLGEQSFTLQPGQRVLCQPGFASPVTIEGESYLAVRQDYIAAILEDKPQYAVLPLNSKYYDA